MAQIVNMPHIPESATPVADAVIEKLERDKRRESKARRLLGMPPNITKVAMASALRGLHRRQEDPKITAKRKAKRKAAKLARRRNR